MRILWLELENIKSYSGPTRVDLTGGLNAVCGLNGSGKTTVLEAIGFALFDSLPYKQQAFIREGQKGGTVRVGILAPDGREYEVVRKVGTGAGHFIADVETGMRVAERKETLTWIREKALDIEGDVDLEALFESAVGVPQGTMTADFQNAARVRKSVFDPLLRVEEYQQAYDYLRETVSYLRDSCALLDQEIAVLRADVEQIPDKQEQVRIASEAVERSEARLAGLVEQLELVERQRREFDDVESVLRALEDDLRGAEYDVRRAADLVEQRIASLHQSEEALRIVQASEAGYEAVLAARKQLGELEGRRLQRDGLVARLAEAQADRNGVYGTISELDMQRDAAVKAGEDAAGLVDAVARQEAVELEASDVRQALADASRLDTQIARLSREIVALESACSARDGQMARAQKARTESEKLPEAQAALADCRNRLNQILATRERQDALTRDGTELRTRSKRLAADVSRRRELEREVAKHTPVAAMLDHLLDRQRSIDERRAFIRATHEYQEVASRELQRQQCPLLDLRCPVVSADRSVLDSLEAREAALTAEATEIERESVALDREIVVSRQAAVSLQRCQVELGKFGNAEAELAGVEAQIESLLAEHKALDDILAMDEEWRAEHGVLRQEVARLQEAVSTAGGLAVLEEQQSRDLQVLELQRNEMRALRAERERLGTQTDRARELENELAALGDPRGRQQRLLVLASRQREIENRLGQEQARLAEAGGRVKAHVAALEMFAGLDEEITRQREIERRHAIEHDRYLQHRSDALEIEARRESVTRYEESLAAAIARRDAMAARIDEVRGSYDAERHRSLKEECDAAGKDVVREGAVLEHARDSRDRAGKELAYLRQREERLHRREGEHAELDRVRKAIVFIRETIKAAGPAVTENLLASISQGANDIYAEIMDDHASELRWDREYEVLVQRGAETRAFPQLSGGEQMSAALAVRLALLKEMSEVQFAFFDEPTQNMDSDRRGNLAEQIRSIRGFEQLIVISHDDTFEHHTDNLIRLRKVNEETEVG